jgi:hypothetical protein
VKTTEDFRQFVVLSGSFRLEAKPLTEEGPVSIELSAEGFQANPRGLGFALGTVVAWFLDGVAKEEPETPLTRLLLMAEIHRGMQHAMQEGEIVPQVKQ